MQSLDLWNTNNWSCILIEIKLKMNIWHPVIPVPNLLEHLVPVHWECCFFSRAFWQWSNKQSTWRSKEVCRVRSPVTEKKMSWVKNIVQQRLSLIRKHYKMIKESQHFKNSVSWHLSRSSLLCLCHMLHLPGFFTKAKKIQKLQR